MKPQLRDNSALGERTSLYLNELIGEWEKGNISYVMEQLSWLLQTPGYKFDAIVKYATLFGEESASDRAIKIKFREICEAPEFALLWERALQQYRLTSEPPTSFFSLAAGHYLARVFPDSLNLPQAAREPWLELARAQYHSFKLSFSSVADRVEAIVACKENSPSPVLVEGLIAICQAAQKSHPYLGHALTTFVYFFMGNIYLGRSEGALAHRYFEESKALLAFLFEGGGELSANTFLSVDSFASFWGKARDGESVPDFLSRRVEEQLSVASKGLDQSAAAASSSCAAAYRAT